MIDIPAYLAELAEMTQLIASVSDGRVTYDTFSQRYGSYYWEAALDGHEASEVKQILESTRTLLPLHAEAQAILDAAYSGPAKHLRPSTARISPSDAALQLRNLGTRHDVVKAVAEADALYVRQRETHPALESNHIG